MNILRKIFSGISLTAAMFVFQACYGTNEPFVETNMTFHVVSDEDGSPMSNVMVQSVLLNPDSTESGAWYLDGYTDSDGNISVWAMDRNSESLTRYRFTADESTHVVKDTVISDISADIVEIVLVKANGR